MGSFFLFFPTTSQSLFRASSSVVRLFGCSANYHEMRYVMVNGLSFWAKPSHVHGSDRIGSS